MQSAKSLIEKAFVPQGKMSYMEASFKKSLHYQDTDG
jgi:hypothetical protein